MPHPAIIVENISKAYRIGLKEQQHDTLGATIVSWAKSPLKNLKRLRNLSKFDNTDDADIFWALKDINFEVKKGEVLGIIGKNGAGKSTLLKILSRITEPSEGRVEIYGRVASLLEVGTGFNPELTGRENVFLNGTILGMTKKEIEARFDEIIDFSGIEKFIDTPVKRYSSGMKVRLAFAVAAHLDPEILIIDEVLAVGDAEFQKKCLGKMKDLSGGKGRTVLFVSHNMAAIQQLCSSIILLKNGELIDAANNIVSNEKLISKYLQLDTVMNQLTLGLSEFPRESKFIKCLQNIEISTMNNNSGNIFFAGDKLKFMLTINTPTKVTDPRIAIAIEDSMSTRIMTFLSFSFIEELVPNNDYIFEAVTERLHLAPGNYYLSLSISDKKTGMIDNLSNFTIIEFGWNNNYNNGEEHYNYYGSIITKSTWKVRN
jgi:lipopolysaccharide transport system ATP-binding protein